MAELEDVPGFDLEEDAPQEQPVLDPYWPLREGDDFVSALKDKEGYWQKRAQEIGIWGIWRVAFCAFHGLDVDTGEHQTSRMGYAGSKGQLLQVSLGAYRSFLLQKNTLMIGQRPAFKCLSRNTDRSNQTMAEIGDEFVTFDYTAGDCEKLERIVGEIAGVLGSGAAHTYWDFDGGEDIEVDEQVDAQDGSIDPTTGQPAKMTTKVKKKSGSPKSVEVFPWNLIEEPEAGETYWQLVKEPNVSKHVLAASWPEFAEAILAGGGDDDSEYAQLGLGQFFSGTQSNPDRGTLRHFYHKRCKAIPDGLYVLVFANTEIYRGPLPLKKGMPIASIKPSTFFTTKFPYANGWDLLVLQSVINQLLSDEVSNFARFGRSNLLVERGSDLSIKQMADGGKLFAVARGTEILPQYLLGGQSPAKSGDLREELDARMQDQSGLNAIARGDTKSSVTSGTMAALYKDTALEFMSSDQAELDKFRADVATTRLRLLQAYGQGPFLAEVSGIQNRPFIKEFTREDISGYERVIVETSAAILRSIPGRLELMERVSKFPVEERGAVIEMVTTGSIDGFTEDTRSRDQRIRQENEDLQTGRRPVKAAVTDPHDYEMPKHRELIDRLRTSDDAESPEGQAAIGRALAHLADHRDKFLKSDPVMDKLLGIPEPPPLPGTPAATFQQQLSMGSMMSGAPPGTPPGGPQAPGAEQGPPKPPPPGAGPSAPAKEPTAGGANTPGGVPLPKAAKAPPGPMSAPEAAQ